MTYRLARALEIAEIVPALVDWAKGDVGSQAAVNLLANTFGGRFLHPDASFVQFDEPTGKWWVDFERMAEAPGPASSGEKTVLKIAASLAGEGQVTLSDMVGLDPDVSKSVHQAFGQTLQLQRNLRRSPGLGLD